MPVETATEPSYRPAGRQINKVFVQTQKGFFSFSGAQPWAPCVNLYETQRAYLVCVDLAGVERQELEISVTKHQLVLHGSRAVPIKHDDTAECGSPRYRVHLMEIDHGPFCRAVDLPTDVRDDGIAAAVHNGLLWIELAKKP